MQKELSATVTHWSDENTIDLVRKLRNDLIKDFLDERHLKTYVAAQYNVRELAAVKLEFVKAELKELLIKPVDTNHYRSIIDDIRERGSAALTEGNDRLFYKEIEQILKRYLF